MSEEFTDIQQVEELENPQHIVDDINTEVPVEETPVMEEQEGTHVKEIIEDNQEETGAEEVPEEENEEEVTPIIINPEIYQALDSVTNRLFTSYNTHGAGTVNDDILASCYNGLILDESTGNIWYKGTPYGNAYIGGNYGSVAGDKETLMTTNAYEFAIGTNNCSHNGTQFSIGTESEERKNSFEIIDGKIYSTSLDKFIDLEEQYNGNNPTDNNDLSYIINKIYNTNIPPVEFYDGTNSGAVLSYTDSESSSIGSIAFGENCKALGKYTQAFGKDNVVDSIGINEEDLIGALCILVKHIPDTISTPYVCSNINEDYDFTFTDYINTPESWSNIITINIKNLYVGYVLRDDEINVSYEIIDISHNLINSSAAFGVDNYVRGKNFFIQGNNNFSICNNQYENHSGPLNFQHISQIQPNLHEYKCTDQDIIFYNGDEIHFGGGLQGTMVYVNSLGGSKTFYCEYYTDSPYGTITRRNGVCKNKYYKSYTVENNMVVGSNNIITAENNYVLGNNNMNLDLSRLLHNNSASIYVMYNGNKYNFEHIELGSAHPIHFYGSSVTSGIPEYIYINLSDILNLFKKYKETYIYDINIYEESNSPNILGAGKLYGIYIDTDDFYGDDNKIIIGNNNCLHGGSEDRPQDNTNRIILGYGGTTNQITLDEHGLTTLPYTVYNLKNNIYSYSLSEKDLCRYIFIDDTQIQSFYGTNTIVIILPTTDDIPIGTIVHINYTTSNLSSQYKVVINIIDENDESNVICTLDNVYNAESNSRGSACELMRLNSGWRLLYRYHA